MTLDIRGSLKNTRISKDPLVVVNELISNSIDAYLIRRSNSAITPAFEVDLKVSARPGDLFNDSYELRIKASDNGCGLGPEQLKAFLTKDTCYKDDLSVPGIGRCKGIGRVQFFHHFRSISISSDYATDDGYASIYLPEKADRKTLEMEDFQRKECKSTEPSTQISLSGRMSDSKEPRFTEENIQKHLAAGVIKQKLLFNLLQRFVSLKQDLKGFRIFVESNLNGVETKAVLAPEDIPRHTSSKEVTIRHIGEGSDISSMLTVTHYKLSESDYELPRNVIGLCANASVAEIITRKYLKTSELEKKPIDGHFHIILIEGSLLDEGVNEQRDGFDKIPKDSDEPNLFAAPQITFEDIFKALDEVIQGLITPPHWSRDEIVADVAEDFGISEEIISHSNTRVKYGDTPEEVVKRVLTNLQEKVIEETLSLNEMRDSISKLEPDSEDFRSCINLLSWKFASSLKTIDMTHLSQLVVRRSNIIYVLDLAVNRGLAIQADMSEGKRRKDESLIHNIFFPMRKDSDEVVDHDVWLLSEEYSYYNYIASDMPLSQIRWSGSESFFDPTIDEEVSNFLRRISSENSKRRPDLALFHEEGSAVIIEFKAPGVSLDEHDNDLMEYATLLAAKSGGRLNRFYGYLIGDSINRNRLMNYLPLAGNQGYFTRAPITDPITGNAIAHLYQEIIFYKDVVERARKRISVYRERLHLPEIDNIRVRTQ